MIESNDQLLNVSIGQLYLEEFRKWLGTRRTSAVENRYHEVLECAEIAGMSNDTRMKLIQDVVAETEKTTAAASAVAVHRILQHCVRIIDGTIDPLDVLMEDDVLTKMYDQVALWDNAEFFELLDHQTPSWRVLEIGAGTGGTTNII